MDWLSSPQEGSEDDGMAGAGLFVVNRRKLWNRETLPVSGSEVIDVWLGDSCSQS